MLLLILATLVTSLHADFWGSPFRDRETKHRCQVWFCIGGAACLAHGRSERSTCSCIPYVIRFAELHSNFKAHFTLLFSASFLNQWLCWIRYPPLKASTTMQPSNIPDKVKCTGFMNHSHQAAGSTGRWGILKWMRSPHTGVPLKRIKQNLNQHPSEKCCFLFRLFYTSISVHLWPNIPCQHSPSADNNQCSTYTHQTCFGPEADCTCHAALISLSLTSRYGHPGPGFFCNDTNIHSGTVDHPLWHTCSLQQSLNTKSFTSKCVST